jgi:type I restriction enzyme S subunit
MRFGLDDNILEQIIKVFEANPKVDKALVFGSRAKGNYRPDSDIDIAIKGQEVNFTDILRLSGKLDELNLPYKMDLLDYNTTEEPALVEHIDRVGVEVYSRWKEYILGDIINLKRGYDLPSQNRTTGSIPIFSSSGITDYHNISMKEGPGVITGRYGTIGKVFYTDKPYWPLNTTLYVQDFKGNLPKYIFYFLQGLDFEKYSDKSAVPGINRNELHKEFVVLPPLTEQTTIASILSSLDDKIDLLQRQNKTLEQLAETLFRQWFVEEAEESWEDTTLENHIEVFRGLSYKGIGLTDINLGLPMHNLNSVNEGGGYKHEGIKFYKGEYRERHLVNVGDIIVTNTEQGHEYKLIGFPAIVPDYFGEMGLFSQHIYKLVPIKVSYLSREFIYYLLMTSSVREQIISATNGSTVNMLAIDGLQRPKFKLPPKEKVNDFTAIVKSYWIKKNANQTQIRTLTQLRDTLLPKLMSGEIKVEM